MVALAGAELLGAKNDTEAAHELTRQLKTVGAEPGESLPFVIQLIVARTFLTVDPAYAQMLAKALLDDVVSASGETSQEALSAAFLLMQASMAVGEFEFADELANTWMPRALEVGHGSGALDWMAVLENEEGDSE